jgi:AcrR family transcriptional regulator
MQKSKPGRPRSRQVDRAVLETALRHLSEYGYGRMSIDAVAADAGVGKTSIYRRWKDKADLATAALELVRVAEPAAPERGSTLAKLRWQLNRFRMSLLRPNGMALIGVVLSEEEQTPELLRHFRQRIVAPRRRLIASILEAAKGAGELTGRADIDAAVNLLVGSLYARYLSGEAVDERWVNRVTGLVWNGIRR